MKEKIGYKVMSQDMTCDGGDKPFQYELGKTYEIEGKLEICRNGFHFCKNIFNTLEYYNNIKGDKRFFKIQYDMCIDDWDKSVTNKITILEEVNIFDFINDSMSEDDWYWISIFQKLSEEFISELQDKVDWAYVSMNQKLSEEFISEFQDKVDWYRISRYQTLSEDFIREFQDKVHWYWISVHQQLSDSFKEEFKSKPNQY